MKQNKSYSIIKLFIFHIFLYAIIYTLIYDLIIFVKTEFFKLYYDSLDFTSFQKFFKLIFDGFLKVLLSPFTLFFIEGFYILLAPLLFIIILYFKPNYNYFWTYLVSCFTISLLTYIIQLLNYDNFLNIVVMSYDGNLIFNRLYFVIPSLLIAILTNRFIFGKSLFKKNVS